MKKITVLLAGLVLFCSSTLFAEKFDWSQCWCNYGAGIEKGDKLLSVDIGLNADVLPTFSLENWFVPSFLVDFQIAQPIGKLPFTFGGYVGYNIQGCKGYTVTIGEISETFGDYVNHNIYFGGTAAYHVKLPPKKLDVYVTTRIGGVIRLYNKNMGLVPFKFDFAETIGASWYFSDNFGVNAEFGYPLNKIGVIFKF